MKVRLYALIIFLLFGTIGCYATITGTVVDSETGEPIEGAVVLVEWTKTKGLPGLTHSESYKVIEAVTDKNGKVTIDGVSNPTVNPPHVTVYKKGYVAWNNKYIFPTWEKRKDFEYKNGITIQLQHFKKNYSHYDHASFIGSGAVSGGGGKLLYDAYSWERILGRQELEKLKKGTEKR